jgi:hypothetical protein
MPSGGVEHDVAAGALVQEGRRRHCRLGIDQRLEHPVVDDHLLDGVLALLAVLGDDHSDGLAHESHLVDGQASAGDRRVERGRLFDQPEIRRGVDADDTGQFEGRRRVDPENATVRDGGPYVGHAGRAGEQRLVEEIVDVLATTREELGILFA